jgi:GntR family transcriptional regulator
VALKSGEWAADEQLPTEMALVKRFGVSRPTIREALRALEAEGLVIRRRGRGTFVRRDKDGTRLATITNVLLGYEADVRVVRADRTPAAGEVAAFLRVAKGQLVRRFVRVEVVGGAPLSVVVNYLPMHIGRRIALKDLRGHSMLDLLRGRLRILLGTMRQTIQAVTPDDEVASLLEIDVTQPVLFLRRLVPDTRGNPVQVSDMFYRGERFRYEMELPFAAIPRRRAQRNGRFSVGDK